jgi:hypothetical protein
VGSVPQEGLARVQVWPVRNCRRERPGFGLPTSRPGRPETPGHEAVYNKASVDFEVEDIRDLKVRSIEQNNVPTDQHMRVVRRRRRKGHFQLPRAGMHLSPKPRRQRSANH